MLFVTTVVEAQAAWYNQEHFTLKLSAFIGIATAIAYNICMFRRHKKFGASGTNLLLVIEMTGCASMFFATLRLFLTDYGDVLRGEDYIYFLAGIMVAFLLFLGHTVKAFFNINKPLPPDGEPKTED